MKKAFCISALLSLFLLLPAIPSASQEQYKTETDIRYSPFCTLDFHYPTNVTGFPTIVWFHGGGLEAGHKEIPQELKNEGFGVIGVEYRLMPTVQVDDCIDDAAAAVAWAFREVTSRGGSADKIFVAGHSAGGYLTDMIVLDKSRLAKYGIDADRIAGAFPYSGQVITHYNVRKQDGVGPLSPRIDETAPLHHLRALPMPMLVLSGDRELELYGRYEEQAYFWRMMKLTGNDNIFIYEFKGFDHGSMVRPAHEVVKRFIHELYQR